MHRLVHHHHVRAAVAGVPGGLGGAGGVQPDADHDRGPAAHRLDGVLGGQPRLGLVEV